ncbi:MAG: LytTR family DNA-binding domain-containing protein [Roseburia sp.]|nr:LytTR family DNA-binding domain-containing protein [Roseburia sp.]
MVYYTVDKGKWSGIKMYDVVICDDATLDREFLKEEILENEKYGKLLRIHEYNSGRALLKDMGKINFSIIFLDIQMKGMDGEQTAEEIRKLNESVVIVFFTGYAEPTQHSFEVQAYRFIKKNMPDVERKKAINDSLEKMAAVAQMPYITAKSGRKKIVLHADDIIYIEKYRKYLKVHLSQGAKMRHQIAIEEDDIRIYDKLENIYDMLKAYGFGYPHGSYIINFRFIMSYTDEGVELEGFPNIIFKVSRGRKTEFNDMKRLFFTSKY